MGRENGKAIKIKTTIIYMKATILMIKSMDKESSHGQAEIFIRVITKMMIDMETDKCYGQMEACTRENGKMEFSMVLEE